MAKKIMAALSFLIPFSAQLFSMEQSNNSNNNNSLMGYGNSANNGSIRFAQILNLVQDAQKLQVSADSTTYHRRFTPVDNNAVAQLAQALKKGFEGPISGSDSLNQKQNIPFSPEVLNKFLHDYQKPAFDKIDKLKKAKKEYQNMIFPAVSIGLVIGSIPTFAYIGIKAWTWWQEKK